MPDPVETKVETPPAEKPITRADLEGERALLRDVVGRTVQESVRALLDANKRPDPPAHEPELDEEALAAAIAEGGKNAVEAARALARHEARKAAADLKRTDVDPIATDGVASLAVLTRDAAVAKMKHYKKYQGEIDAALDELGRTNPRALTNLNTVMGVYRYIVGVHSDELESEAREAAIREQKEEEAAPPAPKGREAIRGNVPETAEEYFGEGAVAALAELRDGRMGMDDLARSMGYEDGATYAQMGREQPWGPMGMKLVPVLTDRGYVLGPPPKRDAAKAKAS